MPIINVFDRNGGLLVTSAKTVKVFNYVFNTITEIKLEVDNKFALVGEYVLSSENTYSNSGEYILVGDTYYKKSKENVYINYDPIHDSKYEDISNKGTTFVDDRNEFLERLPLYETNNTSIYIDSITTTIYDGRKEFYDNTFVPYQIPIYNTDQRDQFVNQFNITENLYRFDPDSFYRSLKNLQFRIVINESFNRPSAGKYYEFTNDEKYSSYDKILYQFEYPNVITTPVGVKYKNQDGSLVYSLPYFKEEPYPTTTSLIDSIYIENPKYVTINKSLEYGPPKKQVSYETKNLFAAKLNISGYNSFICGNKEINLSDVLYFPNDIAVKYKFDKQLKDTTYLQKLFVVDITNDYTSTTYVPNIRAIENVSSVPDSFYSKITINNPKLEIFKKSASFIKSAGLRLLSTDSITDPKFYYDDGTVKRHGTVIIEYVYWMFMGVNQYMYTSNKVPDMKFHKIESGHARLGGSNAFGYSPIVSVERPKGLNQKLLDIKYIKENETGNAGRGGRHVAQRYEEIQIVQNISSGDGENGIYEFDYIDHSLDNSIADGALNFQYELVSGGLPDCLKLSPIDNKITGRISEIDAFLNNNAYLGWVKEQGHAYTLDNNYFDFKMINPRVIKLEYIGYAASSGILSVFAEDAGVPSYRVNDIISQPENNVTAVIKKFINTSTVAFDFNDGEGVTEKVVHNYSIDNLTGLVSTTENIVEKNTRTLLYSQYIQEIINDILANDPNNTEALDTYNSILNGLDESNDYTVVLVEYQDIELVFKSVVNQDGVSSRVYSFEVDRSFGVKKYLTLYIPVKNNWTYDKELLLYTFGDNQQKIVVEGTEYTREEWIDYMKSKGSYKFDPQSNRDEMKKHLEQLKLDFANGLVDMTQEEYDNYIEEQLNNITYYNENMENKTLQYENISPYTLACSVDVPASQFYNTPPIYRSVRGFPIYASCK